jgi:hypothetical protein
MKNIRIAFAFALLLSSTFAFSQSYKTAGGIRINKGIDLTIQQFIADGWTAEGILHSSIGSQNLGITLLAEKHHKVLFRNTNFYTGAGIHYYSKNEPINSEVVSNNVMGVSVIGGIEVSIGRINLGFDWKPEIHLTGGGRTLDYYGAALSARYIFVKRERKKVSDWKVWDKFDKKDHKRRS